MESNFVPTPEYFLGVIAAMVALYFGVWFFWTGLVAVFARSFSKGFNKDVADRSVTWFGKIFAWSASIALLCLWAAPRIRQM